MLKSRHPKLAFVALLLAVTGCNQVVCERPVGEKPASIVAAEWEGNWIGPDGLLTIKVADVNQAILKVVWLEDEGGQPTVKTAVVELRESGDWLFASTRDEDGGNGYLWARIKKEHRQILVWEPEEKAFAKLVGLGVFAGRIDQNNVILEEIDSLHLSIVKAGDYGVLFSWDEPLILRALN